MPVGNAEPLPHERRAAYRVKIPSLDLVSLAVDTGLGYPVDYTVTDLSECGSSIRVLHLLAGAHPLQIGTLYRHAKLYWRASLQLELNFSLVAERCSDYHCHYGIAFVDCSPLIRRRLATLALQFQQRNQEMARLFGPRPDLALNPLATSQT